MRIGEKAYCHIKTKHHEFKGQLTTDKLIKLVRFINKDEHTISSRDKAKQTDASAVSLATPTQAGA